MRIWKKIGISKCALADDVIFAPNEETKETNLVKTKVMVVWKRDEVPKKSSRRNRMRNQVMQSETKLETMVKNCSGLDTWDTWKEYGRQESRQREKEEGTQAKKPNLTKRESYGVHFLRRKSKLSLESKLQLYEINNFNGFIHKSC